MHAKFLTIKTEIRDIGIQNNIKINIAEVGCDNVGLTNWASINGLLQ
jgi:hypothetical protein